MLSLHLDPFSADASTPSCQHYTSYPLPFRLPELLGFCIVTMPLIMAGAEEFDSNQISFSIR
jgi:hypothetical protein